MKITKEKTKQSHKNQKMPSAINREFWIEFFELFKQFPEIWNVKSEKYKNRWLKQNAFASLLAKYQELDPNATEVILKKKINNLRSCYCRELKKVNNSLRSARGTEDIYKPSLWYYDKLDFLNDHEEKYNNGGVLSLKAEQSFAGSHNNTPGPLMPPNAKRKKAEPKLYKDEAEVHAASWAAFFRKLDSKQQLFANKTITEVLFQASMGKLNEHSHRLFEMNVVDMQNTSVTTNFSNYPVYHHNS
ncbi:uncharacterized protein LOC129916338 [Episyrphus balteatus]|uniref:uncharacterized protein LOC129916338 n=1 Tax=Episyrphus balteatus TaxID=286459 RepID=UPI0024857CB0|nr:uncharacterized protein LOC129916338 [Episyrphus balteatus]